MNETETVTCTGCDRLTDWLVNGLCVVCLDERNGHREASSSARVSRDTVGRPVPAREPDEARFDLVPLDWGRLQLEGLPEVEYLYESHVPARAGVWASGPTESSKSIWAMWLAARLSREGRNVAFVSMENPLAEDTRRLDMLRPDWDRFTFYHHEQQPEVFDLVRPDHIEALICVARGQAFGVLDTFTGCWSGDENDNKAFNVFYRDVMRRVVDETGASILVIDHTGHAQPFTRREGAEAARGASSKGQKCDSFLQFKGKGDRAFEIVHGKARMGGTKAPPARLKIIDTDDGGLDIVPSSAGDDATVVDAAADIVSAVEAGGGSPRRRSRPRSTDGTRSSSRRWRCCAARTRRGSRSTSGRRCRSRARMGWFATAARPSGDRRERTCSGSGNPRSRLTNGRQRRSDCARRTE
jgi:hypothetical protein